jgi:hypothetical protein
MEPAEPPKLRESNQAQNYRQVGSGSSYQKVFFFFTQKKVILLLRLNIILLFFKPRKQNLKFYFPFQIDYFWDISKLISKFNSLSWWPSFSKRLD